MMAAPIKARRDPSLAVGHFKPFIFDVILNQMAIVCSVHHEGGDQDRSDEDIQAV